MKAQIRLRWKHMRTNPDNQHASAEGLAGNSPRVQIVYDNPVKIVVKHQEETVEVSTTNAAGAMPLAELVYNFMRETLP